MSEIDCRDVLRRIELYLDGELDSAIVVDIEEHLGACDGCMGRSDFQRHLKELLRDKCGCEDVPASVVERVRLVITRESRGG